MSRYFIAYATTAIFFLGLDFVWLAKVAKRFYFDRLEHLMLDTPRLGAAAGFYAMYVVGIVYFAVAPALRSDSLSYAMVNGALFGFFAYATYDMTNFATLRNWPLSVVLLDIAWGTLLTGVSAAFGFWLTRLFTGGA